MPAVPFYHLVVVCVHGGGGVYWSLAGVCTGKCFSPPALIFICFSAVFSVVFLCVALSLSDNLLSINVVLSCGTVYRPKELFGTTPNKVGPRCFVHRNTLMHHTKYLVCCNKVPCGGGHIII